MSATSPLMKLKLPAVTDNVDQTIADLTTNFNIIDALYPIGRVIFSTNKANPSTYIGGSWSQITDKFLVGAGSTFAAGTTGGSTTMGIAPSGDEAAGYGLNPGAGGFINRVMVTTNGYTGKNFPPYKAVYIWERIA